MRLCRIARVATRGLGALPRPGVNPTGFGSPEAPFTLVSSLQPTTRWRCRHSLRKRTEHVDELESFCSVNRPRAIRGLGPTRLTPIFRGRTRRNPERDSQRPQLPPSKLDVLHTDGEATLPSTPSRGCPRSRTRSNPLRHPSSPTRDPRRLGHLRHRSNRSRPFRPGGLPSRAPSTDDMLPAGAFHTPCVGEPTPETPLSRRRRGPAIGLPPLPSLGSKIEAEAPLSAPQRLVSFCDLKSRELAF